MTLIQLRRRLDVIDRKILRLLSIRQQMVINIAAWKKINHGKIHQPQREVQILADKIQLARQFKLSPKFINRIFRMILAESKRVQRSLIK